MHFNGCGSKEYSYRISLQYSKSVIFLDIQMFGPGVWFRLFPFGPGKYNNPSSKQLTSENSKKTSESYRIMHKP